MRSMQSILVESLIMTPVCWLSMVEIVIEIALTSRTSEGGSRLMVRMFASEVAHRMAFAQFSGQSRQMMGNLELVRKVESERASEG